MIELPSPLKAIIFQSIVERLWLQLNLVMYNTSDFIYAVMWNAFLFNQHKKHKVYKGPSNDWCTV
jgi:hypothetical protein